MLDNLFQSSWVLLCCGGVLLVIILAALARRAASSSGRRAASPGETGWSERGTERPRYDSPDVESSGGFGRAPSQRQRRTETRSSRERNRGAALDQGPGGFQDLDDRLANQGWAPEEPEPRTRRKRDRDRERDDDDEVRSRGGFGGD